MIGRHENKAINNACISHALKQKFSTQIFGRKKKRISVRHFDICLLITRSHVSHLINIYLLRSFCNCCTCCIWHSLTNWLYVLSKLVHLAFSSSFHLILDPLNLLPFICLCHSKWQSFSRPYMCTNMQAVYRDQRLHANKVSLNK